MPINYPVQSSQRIDDNKDVWGCGYAPKCGNSCGDFCATHVLYMYHTCKHLIVETIYILDDQVNNDDVDEDDGDDDENVKG